MPISIEEATNESVEFVYQTTNRREITDKETGNKVKLVTALVNMKLAGRTQTPYLEGMCPIEAPKGLILEQGKLKAFTVFEQSNKELWKTIVTPERTQLNGLVKISDVKVESDIGETTAQSKEGDLNVFDEEGEVKFTIPESESVIVIGKTKDKKSLKVKTRGESGYFTQLYNKVGETIFEKRDELGIQKDTPEEVAKMIKHPGYFPKNKETGEFDKERSPSMFTQFLYYKDRETGEENFCTFLLAGTGEKLNYRDLMNCSFHFIPVYDFKRYLIRGAVINPQLKVVSCIVTKMEKIERKLLQNADAYSVTDEQTRKNLEILAKAREEAASQSASPVRDTDEKGEEDIDALMTGMEDVDLTVKTDDDPEVPGL